MKKIKVGKETKMILVLLAGLVAFVAFWILVDMSTKAKLWGTLVQSKEGLECIKTMRHANPGLYSDMERCYQNVQTLLHIIELS